MNSPCHRNHSRVVIVCHSLYFCAMKLFARSISSSGTPGYMWRNSLSRLKLSKSNPTTSGRPTVSGVWSRWCSDTTFQVVSRSPSPPCQSPRRAFPSPVACDACGAARASRSSRDQRFRRRSHPRRRSTRRRRTRSALLDRQTGARAGPRAPRAHRRRSR